MQKVPVRVATWICPLAKDKDPKQQPIMRTGLPPFSVLKEGGWHGFRIEQQLIAETDPRDGPVVKMSSAVFAQTKLMIIGGVPVRNPNREIDRVLEQLSDISEWAVPDGELILVPEARSEILALPADPKKWRKKMLFAGLEERTVLDVEIEPTRQTTVVYDVFCEDEPDCPGHLQKEPVSHRDLQGLHFPSGTRTLRFVDYVTVQAMLPGGKAMRLGAEPQDVSSAYYVDGKQITAKAFARKFGKEVFVGVCQKISDPKAALVVWEDAGLCVELKDGDSIVPFQP